MLVVVGLNVSMELCLVLTVLDLVGFLFYCHRVVTICPGLLQS